MAPAWKGRLFINQQVTSLPRFVYYWIPVIGYGILIFYISSLEIRIRQIPFTHYDKVFHLMEYGVFAWLWYRALRVSLNTRHRGWLWLATLLIPLMVAGLDEVYQSMNPVRESDFYDFLADALGAFLVMVFFIFKK